MQTLIFANYNLFAKITKIVSRKNVLPYDMWESLCSALVLLFSSQFDNHVFVAVNGDGTESEEMLMRKLHVFNRILGILYGPATHRCSKCWRKD